MCEARSRIQCSQDPPRRGGYFLQGLFFFFFRLFWWRISSIFFFFWRARVEDYPPRGFIVGGHFVSPEGANIFPSLYAPSRAAP